MEGRSAVLPDPNLEYQYDCLYILRTNLPPNEVEQATEQFRGVVVDNDGGIIQITPMGQKRLTYEIRDEKEGIYVDMLFWGKPAVEELRRRLRIDTRVIRHIIVKETDRQYKARIRAGLEKGARTPADTVTVVIEDEPTEGEPAHEEADAEALATPESSDADEAPAPADEGDDADQAPNDDIEDDEEWADPEGSRPDGELGSVGGAARSGP